MSKRASDNGVLTNQIKDLFEGTILNRPTNASVVNTGLGLGYASTVHQRAGQVTADVYYAFVDAFNGSNAAVKFNEQANMLAVGADMIFPTDMTIAEKRPDIGCY